MTNFHTDTDNSTPVGKWGVMVDPDFKDLINTPTGRRFLRRVLGECGVMQAAVYFHPGRPVDPLEMAYNEGRRSIGRWLVGLFAEFPDQYLQLLREQVDEGVVFDFRDLDDEEQGL